MQIFNQIFNAKQSGAHPKGVQVTHLAIYGSPLGSIGLSHWLPRLVYVDPKV